MPITNSAISVGTAATLIAGPSINAKVVYVQDGQYSDQSEVWVGGPDVTTATGMKMSKVSLSVFQVNGDDALYAVGSSESSSVRVTQVS